MNKETKERRLLEPGEVIDDEIWRRVYLKVEVDENGVEKFIDCNVQGIEMSNLTAKRLARLRTWT